jgi:hypothetical protein
MPTQSDGGGRLKRVDFNRVALGVNDGERGDLDIKGAAGKRLTLVNLTKRDLSRLARRLRWRDKHRQKK